MSRPRLFALLLLALSSPAFAIDPSELVLTVDGAYARPLGPQRFADGFYGFGGLFMIERAVTSKVSVGLAFESLTLTEGGGNRFGFSAIDLIGRRWFQPWKGFNPYLLGGIGADLFKDSFKQPFGDVFHAHAALGSTYVLDTHWALDYAVDWHLVAPLDTPHHWVGARFGLSYRYGTQPHVNRIAPNPHQAQAVEVLSAEKVEQVAGRVEYKVKPGDSLYRIAGRESAYKRPILWPLLFQENQDQIKDPHLIQPDQVIMVRRNYSSEQAEKARQTATETLYRRPTAAR